MAEHLREVPAPYELDRLGRPLVGPCLIWTDAAADRMGYGVMGNSEFGSTAIQRTHRVAWALAHGVPLDQIRTIPELDHLCRRTLCGQATHLEPVTHGENIRRGDLNLHKKSQTECLRGHAYDEANTVIQSNGGRSCRTCKNERSRRVYDPAQRAARHQAKRSQRPS